MTDLSARAEQAKPEETMGLLEELAAIIDPLAFCPEAENIQDRHAFHEWRREQALEKARAILAAIARATGEQP